MTEQNEIPDYLNSDNPRSMYNMVPAAFQRAMERIPKEYLTMDESDIHDQVKPNTTLNCLRFRLWTNYQRAVENGIARIPTKDVCSGICSQSYLTGAVLRNPLMTMWLITPPKSYETSAEEALNFGVTQMRKILNFPLYDSKGQPCIKTAKLQLDVLKTLHAQVRGAPVQRIEQRSMNIHASSREVQDVLASDNMEAIEKRLKELRGEEEKTVLLEEARPKLEEFKTKEIDIEAPVRAYGEGKAKEF